MKRREMVAVFGSIGVTTIAGCIGGNGNDNGNSTADGGNGSGGGSCTAPSTDDLQSLFPSDTETFRGTFGTSEGVTGLGTENYFVGRYQGPQGNDNDLLIAKYASRSAAQSNLGAAFAKGEFPATGYLIVGRYTVIADAQNRELARELVRASALDEGCASELRFSAPTGVPTTQTETETSRESDGESTPASGSDEESTPASETPTETATETPQQVVSSFADDWEDGDYKQNPIWFAEKNDLNTAGTDVSIGVADVTSPDGSKALQYDIDSGKAKLTTGDKLRFDAPWTLDTLVRYQDGIQPSTYAIRFGGGSSGLFGGAAANLGINLFVNEQGSSDRRRVTAKIGGSLIDDAQQIEEILRGDTWYRIRARHSGNGEYELKLWPASESEENAFVAVSRGDPPQTTAEDKLPLRLIGSRGKGSVLMQTAYLDYRTDGAADQ